MPSRSARRTKHLAATAVLLTLALAVAGCQGGESESGSPSARRTSAQSCAEVLDAQTKAAMLRLAGVPASAKAEYSGDVRLTADQLVTQYLTGKADRDHFTFCGFHTGSPRPDFLTVNFSLTQEPPPVDTADSEFKAYRMGRVARVSNRAGFLYFDCSSTKFEGSTQLVRAEVDPLYRVTEPLATAREDYLRALHGSSRVLSRLLGCKPGTGITGSFTVPPAA